MPVLFIWDGSPQFFSCCFFAPKERIRNNRPRFPKVLFVVHEVDDALRQDADHVHRQWEKHHEKVAVVTPTYAVVQPRTVVIKCLKHNTITVTKKSMNKIQSFNFNTSSTKEPKLLFPCSLPTTSILIMGCHANQTFKFIYNVSRMFASPSQRVQVHTAKEVSCVTVNVTSYHCPESDFNQIDSTAIEKTPTLMFLPLPDTCQLHAHRLTFSIHPPPPPVKEKQIASVNKHSKFVTVVLTSIQLLQTLQCEQRGGR